MRIRPILVSLTLSAALVAAAVGAGSLRAGEAGAMEGAPPQGRHPDVGDTARTCDGCHAEVTPEIHRAWYASAHGLNNVKCFVCHGARTERFAVRASTDRCAACHSDQIPAMEAFSRFVGKERAACFECHPPHWLSPHAWTSAEEGEGGAGTEGEEKGGSR